MQDPQLIKEVLEKWKNGQHLAEFEDYALHTIYNPLWADLPHTDIFITFTPDLLHQLHKGIFKDHLVKWCLDIIGKDELDAHFKVMPHYPGLWHFKKGISTVKQWTGTEHKEMQHIFLGILAGAVPSQVLLIARAILDFSYYAQLQIHTNESLNCLKNALSVFHANKNILLDLEVREHFNIPKLHQLSHYVQSILLFGTTDGFNTKLPEQLHINFAEETYRASNKCDYEEQMAQWLQHQEAVFLCSSYLDWLAVPANMASMTRTEPCLVHSLAKNPAHPRQSIQHLVTAHGATMFLQAFKSFLQKHIPHNKIVPGPQDHFDVFRQVVIVALSNPQVNDSPKRWHIQATPEVRPSPGRKPEAPAQFDIALISDVTLPSSRSYLDTVDLRVAQVRIIFTLPHQFGSYCRVLAYVEWFTPLREPDPSSGLCQVSH
ncbi:hypothetical protein BDR03DRAFT_851460, partial [Suillus americanus]